MSVISLFGFTEEEITRVLSDESYTDDAEAFLETVTIDADREVDRSIIREQYTILVNTIKAQRIQKVNARLMGDDRLYRECEGNERLAAKACVAMARKYPWLQG